MCEDYKLAVETFRKLLIQNQPQDEERRTDYQKLIADLERELSEALGGFQK